MQTSWPAQSLLNALLRASASDLIGRGWFRLLLKCRAGLVRLLRDPLVRYQLRGSELLLPLSHDLPVILKFQLHYSSNVARIARHVKSKYPDLTLIDVGANVGDTLALIRNVTEIPVLCIEGDDRFFEILRLNASQYGPGVDLAHVFVDSETGSLKGNVISERGTAYLVEDATSSRIIQTVALRDVLEAHPSFSRTKMIKVDTDGLDCRIIRSDLDLIARLKAVLFFEYDPYLFGKFKDDGFQVFQALCSIGYDGLIVYENNGEYLLTTRLTDVQTLEDLHNFYSGRAGMRYMDVCAFHEEDSDVCQAVRRAEIEFFQRARCGSN